MMTEMPFFRRPIPLSSAFSLIYVLHYITIVLLFKLLCNFSGQAKLRKRKCLEIRNKMTISTYIIYILMKYSEYFSNSETFLLT